MGRFLNLKKSLEVIFEGLGFLCVRKYSEDLNSELVWFSNGPKQLSPQIVRYTTKYDCNYA